MSRMIHRGDTFKTTIPYEILSWPQKVTTEDRMLVTMLDTSTREFPAIALEMWLQSV